MSVTVPSAPPIPDTYISTSPFGGLLIQAMQPWITRDLALYLDALGAACDPLYSLVSDTGSDGDADYLPGYGQLFNVDPSPGQPGYNAPTCKTADLGYAGQFVGVQIPDGADDATARSLVMAESGISRGTDGAVIAAAKRTLTGTQTVFYYRRTFSDGTANAGWAGLVVLASECASLADTKAAVLAVKLGGIQMWFQTASGWTVGAMEGAEALVSDMESGFATVAGMEGDIPFA